MAVLTVTAIGLVLSIVWSQWRAHRRVENERAASTALKTLTSAQADFRANDRDGNGIPDFWTGDVAGLYRFGLIERGVAEADLHPIIPLVPKPVPYHGYFFVAMVRDESENPHEPLCQDTDKKAGKVHHLTKFGFSAQPAEYGITGRETFIVNENNTIRWRHTFGDIMDYWPSDEEMRQDWYIGALEGGKIRGAVALGRIRLPYH